MVFVSSPSPNSTNEVLVYFGVSIANLSDAIVYAFLANQPNGSQLMHEDLEQIHGDDLEEIDLMWQLALLSIRAKRFFQKTGKKITINGSDTAGYDKSKVECFNCHKMEHFAREYRVPRNQKNITKNQETTRRTVNMEDASSKAMVEIDEASFDWSYMADDEAPTNMAFKALSGSEDWESDKKDEVESPPEKERKTVAPSVDKVEVEISKQNKKPAMRPVKYAEMYRTQRPRGNQSNRNNLKSYQLGSNFVMYNKAC
nr:ribonuclease H-like domain-containing protein [Tanacetum cinerariifolium]